MLVRRVSRDWTRRSLVPSVPILMDKLVEKGDGFDSIRRAFDAKQVDKWELVLSSAEDLALRLNRSVNEVSRYAAHWRKEIPPLASMPKELVLETGDEKIDELLGGGLHTSALTEISGESRAGKTGLAAQITAYTLSKGYQVIYIITESITQDQIVMRVKQIAAARGLAGRLPLQHLHLAKIPSPCKIPYILRRSASLLPQDPPVRLVIIDSIGGMNKESIGSIARELRYTASHSNTAVLALNQVRDSPNLKKQGQHTPLWRSQPMQERWLLGWSEDPFANEGDIGQSRKRPTGGYFWTTKIDQRIVLKLSGCARRTMSLVFSPWAPSRTIYTSIDQAGMHFSEHESCGDSDSGSP